MTRLRMILMGFLLLAVGCAQQEGDGVAPVEKARNLRALVLRGGGQIEQLMEIAGPVTPLRGTDLAAEGAGTVVALPVAKGAAVAAGEAVVVQDRVALAAEMEAAKADLKVREFDHEKLVQLFDAGKISRFELLQAERDLAQARSRLKTATHLHARAAISAPFAGLLVDRYIELGQYVLPGQKVARVIARDTLKLTGYLTDLQVAQAEVGRACLVVLGESGLTAPGVIDFVSPEADQQTGKFKTEVLIPDPQRRLRSGVIGRARLSGGIEQGVVIPRDAVLTSLTGTEVFVVRDGRALRAPVVLGSQQGLMVAVRNGLAVGDTLVVRGQRALREGGRVQVIEWSAAADGSLPGDPVPDGGVSHPTGERTKP